jgi:hypothetical protein
MLYFILNLNILIAYVDNAYEMIFSLIVKNKQYKSCYSIISFLHTFITIISR